MAQARAIKLNLRDWELSTVIARRIADLAANIILDGGIAVLPTETSYMLAADATNKKAVTRLRWMKNRPDGMNISVAFHSIEASYPWIDWDRSALFLGKTFLPGPLTLLLPSKKGVPRLPVTQSTIVGVRVPGISSLRKILLLVGRPVTATSANPHDHPEPYSINNCVTDADFYWDAGKLTKNLPSTIVQASDKEVVIVRPGCLSSDEIQKAMNCMETTGN